MQPGDYVGKAGTWTDAEGHAHAGIVVEIGVEPEGWVLVWSAEDGPMYYDTHDLEVMFPAGGFQ